MARPTTTRPGWRYYFDATSGGFVSLARVRADLRRGESIRVLQLGPAVPQRDDGWPIHANNIRDDNSGTVVIGIRRGRAN